MSTAPRWLALALLSTACGARTSLEEPLPDDAPAGDAADGSPVFPSGIYTNCALGIGSASGNILGAQPDASLTLTQSGSTLSAQFEGWDDVTRRYEFALTTGSSAVLVPSGRGEPGGTHNCVLGLGIVDRTPTTLIADVGALQVDGDAVFIGIQGTATDVPAGPCGTLSDRQSVWLTCNRRDRSTPTPSPVAPGAAVFPSGSFACQSQVATYERVGAINEYAADGAMGSLTVVRNGSTLSLSYSGDRTASATMDFVVTASTTARAGSRRTFGAVCDVPIGTPAATSMAPLAGTSGALLMVGSTLFVSVAGTMTAPCADADKFVTLLCTAR